MKKMIDINRRSLCLLIMIMVSLLVIPACGYRLRGTEGFYSSTILGDGTKTIMVSEVDQTSMFPWLPYMVRSSIVELIEQRGIAKVVATTPSDFVIMAKVTNYSNSNENNASGASYLYTIDLSMELVIRNGTSNAIIWRSGTVAYSKSFQSESEDTAVRDVANECVRRAFDKLGQDF